MKLKKNITQLICIVFFALLFCSCKTSQVYLRKNQQLNDTAKDHVVRLYMDKFGNLYPKLSVSINEKTFFNRHFLKRAMYDTTSANLEYYFTGNKNRLDSLRNAYDVNGPTLAQVVFRAAQDSIVAGYVSTIKELCKHDTSRVLVFFVHGYNDPYPMKEYQQARDSISKYGYAAKKKPLYIELYWDGLTAFGYNSIKSARIWFAAVLNPRFVGLSLRYFIFKMEEKVKLPIVIITHSLGAAVATTALFNTESRDSTLKSNPVLQNRLIMERQVTTPIVNVRLGMLAPAIPGALTFQDFNKRSPISINPDQNNISRVVIGYNPWDYAVSKDLFGRLSEAPNFNSTTLGCNYYDRETRYTEIELVFATMQRLGYNTDMARQMLLPIRFKTALRPGSKINREHLMHFYLEDGLNFRPFIRDLFEN